MAHINALRRDLLRDDERFVTSARVPSQIARCSCTDPMGDLPSCSMISTALPVAEGNRVSDRQAENGWRRRARSSKQDFIQICPCGGSKFTGKDGAWTEVLGRRAPLQFRLHLSSYLSSTPCLAGSTISLRIPGVVHNESKHWLNQVQRCRSRRGVVFGLSLMARGG